MFSSNPNPLNLRYTPAHLRWFTQIEYLAQIPRKDKTYAEEVMQIAIYNRDWTTIIKLINKSVSPKATTLLADKSTLLHHAVVSGAYDVVCLILEKDKHLDLQVKNAWAQTPLDAAITQGHWAIAERLLEKTEKDTIDKTSYTATRAINIAAKQGKWNIVLSLVDKGVDINDALDESWEVIACALRTKNLAVLKKLAKKKISGLKFNSPTLISFLSPMIQNRSEIDFFINELKLTDEERNYFLYVLCKNLICENKFELFKSVVKKYRLDLKALCPTSAIPEYTRAQSFLYTAIDHSRVEIVDHFLAMNVPVDTRMLALAEACTARKSPNAQHIYRRIYAEIAVDSLKSACENYMNELTAMINSAKYSAAQQLLAKTRLDFVEDLHSQLTNTKQSTDEKLNSFKQTLNDGINTIKSATDDSGFKKFRRVALAILTLGAYAKHRANKLGSASFWKSKRKVFTDKISHEVSKALGLN